MVWAATTPVNEEWHHRNRAFDRLEADVVAYNSAAGQMARDLGVPVNDLLAVVQQAGRDAPLQPDGVHLTPAGHERIGERVSSFITELLDRNARRQTARSAQEEERSNLMILLPIVGCDEPVVIGCAISDGGRDIKRTGGRQ